MHIINIQTKNIISRIRALVKLLNNERSKYAKNYTTRRQGSPKTY